MDVYADQRIIVIQSNGRRSHDAVLDAETGKPILYAEHVISSAAFTRGFALAYRDAAGSADRYRIDFHDFTGRKTATFQQQDYRLVTEFPFRASHESERGASSGFDVPLVIGASGELAAVDPVTGAITWSKQYSGLHLSPGDVVDVQGIGVGVLCVVGSGVGDADALLLHSCGSESPAVPFAIAGTAHFRGTDGRRVLVEKSCTLASVDSATGSVLWQANPPGPSCEHVQAGDGLYRLQHGAGIVRVI